MRPFSRFDVNTKKRHKYNIMCPVRTVHFNREIRTANGHNLPITLIDILLFITF